MSVNLIEKGILAVEILDLAEQDLHGSVSGAGDVAGDHVAGEEDVVEGQAGALDPDADLAVG